MTDFSCFSNESSSDDEVKSTLKTFFSQGGTGADFISILIYLRVGRDQTSRLLQLLETLFD